MILHVNRIPADNSNEISSLIWFHNAIMNAVDNIFYGIFFNFKIKRKAQHINVSAEKGGGREGKVGEGEEGMGTKHIMSCYI